MSAKMDNREIAIRLRGVKKQYQLGAIGGGTLQQELQSWWAKKRGREDPNMRIGTDTRLYGQKFCRGTAATHQGTSGKVF